MLTKEELLNLSYLEARGKLIELAAFLDRVERYQEPGSEDFRLKALYASLPLLTANVSSKAVAILEALSDMSEEPVEKSSGKAASGAPLSPCIC